MEFKQDSIDWSEIFAEQDQSTYTTQNVERKPQRIQIWHSDYYILKIIFCDKDGVEIASIVTQYDRDGHKISTIDIPEN